jgi:hypothetical protein
MTEASAWNGHALCTWEALQGMPELAGRKVRAESLERFVVAQAPQLERLLEQHEAWAREQVPAYAPRPDELAFRAAAPAESAPPRDRFLLALRLNPFSRLNLHVQLREGEQRAGATLLPTSAITTLASGLAAREHRFAALAEGEEVSALDVVATSSNEPDYGLDLGLYADNGSAYGARMGLGAQPYGNPVLEYSSQAPLHMGFHHEARIVYLAGGFLRRTMVDARIELYSALARHAFASGHDYWGWRFTGWAMHYVQDLTQPYHATALPGVGVLRMLWINALSLLGFEGAKNDAVTLVSNRHAAIEAYQIRRMMRAAAAGDRGDALFVALRDASEDSRHWRYERTSTRGVVSLEAAQAAAALDAQLERSFPRRYTGEPQVTLGPETDLIEMETVARRHSAAEHEGLEQQLAALLRGTGRHSRALVRALAPASAASAPAAVAKPS